MTSRYIKNLTEDMEQQVASEILTDREKILIRLLFETIKTDGRKPEKDDFGIRDLEKRIRSLTDHYDLDSPNMNYLLMLAVLGYRVDWKYFPSEIVPRLRGIHRYFQAKNVLGIPWLVERLKRLKERGIPVMLIKGLALRYYHIPGVPRVMNDFDIAVPEDRFEEVMDLLRDGSVEDKTSTLWADTVVGKCAGKNIELDVHKRIFKRHAVPEQEIWKRALPLKFQGLDVLVPCREDMLIHILDTQARDIFRCLLPENRMKWLFDAGTLMLGEGGKQDLKILASRACQMKTQYTVRLMLVLFSACYGEDPYVRQLADQVQPPSGKYVRWLKAQMQLRREWKKREIYGYGIGGKASPLRAYRTLRLFYREYRVDVLSPHDPADKEAFLAYAAKRTGVAGFSDFKKQVLRLVPDLPSLAGPGKKKGRKKRKGGGRKS